MSGTALLGRVRQHRPLLLACEAIGWLHMTGKAHVHFLRSHAHGGVKYSHKKWRGSLNPPWNARLAWLEQSFPSLRWPTTLDDFVTKFDKRTSEDNLVGLLQAAHAMSSGVEKNLPSQTSRYLSQDGTHMWLVTPFGHPARNLLSDPPPLLRPGGWERLIEQIGALLDKLAHLGAGPCKDADRWRAWREWAIGRHGWLRHAFLSTLAETRLPNNDVTLWDQSYVAAALFKSAVAGAVLAGNAFAWDSGLKNQTRWRVLTVALGVRHYEARAIRIGDWTGAQREIERFFDRVRCFIEVDLAVGSLVYRDGEAMVFTFPGERADQAGSLDDTTANQVKDAILKEIDGYAEESALETPPLCRLSPSTRSFLPMTRELREVRKILAIPTHRAWSVPSTRTSAAPPQNHVCPVCLTRFNTPPHVATGHSTRKGYPCSVCRERRRGRLDAWVAGDRDTIWISEVADDNDRVALLTLSLALAPWLDGTNVDSLRTQSVAEWRRFNPVLRNRYQNPIDPQEPFTSLRTYVESKLGNFDHQDPVLSSLQDGYRWERDWPSFFQKIVEDRADAPAWHTLSDPARAAWIVHQLFRKLPSPGRLYRFWRGAEAFFQQLLERFREIVSAHENRWRTRRLFLAPDAATSGGWQDRDTYAGRWRGAPFEVVYLANLGGFVSISNLARCFGPEETETALAEDTRRAPIVVKGDDGVARDLRVTEARTPSGIGVYAPLIPIHLSPTLFRVLVPLDRVVPCIEAAIAAWREQFARVWDRMPLYVGVVAFPRLTPFQAVIEAARNLEDQLQGQEPELWRVQEHRGGNGFTFLRAAVGSRCEIVQVPTRLPDGRPDVFYPYVEIKNSQLRYPRDFQHPNGSIYRHVSDLRPGDELIVHPSRIAAVFLDTTARRFESLPPRPISHFEQMRLVWDLFWRAVPNVSALRGTWTELQRCYGAWRDADGEWLPEAEAEWLALVRALVKERLGLSGSPLDCVVDAARNGILDLALSWHLTWLKEGYGGAKR